VAHVVEAQRRQPCPAQRSPQDVPQQLIGFDRAALALLVRLARATLGLLALGLLGAGFAGRNRRN
jgi:hypothetical protein